MNNESPVRLTQYSHGAGCGCKISPKVLDEILQSNFVMPDNDRLIVGNHSKDDAAVYDLGQGQALISTTDFFMPIVDDPFEFGRIASANAISDVYAMGGRPILAIAILGWPINTISSAVARKVIEGSRSVCLEAGIPLAGGHSIDSPEPIFGLAVNGLVSLASIKQNNTAQEGDYLLLTKPLGVGILTTAEKKGILQPQHSRLAPEQMMRLNKIGEALGKVAGVHAMTDVTGFGLLGHLVEMADGSGYTASIELNRVPLICDGLDAYIGQNSVPGGTRRNWDSYGQRIQFSEAANSERGQVLLADPQTSGGLLISVSSKALAEVQSILREAGLGIFAEPIGRIIGKQEHAVLVS